MKAPFTRTCSAAAAAFLAIFLATFLAASLAACDKGPSNAAAPGSAVEGQADVARVPSPVADSSVPSASSVLHAPADAARTAASGIRSNDSMSAAQQANAMPLAGQANDHSAPQAPPKPASGR